MRRAPALLLLLFFAGACSEPPQTEIDQAQGAIDAARAAGADQYAADEYGAATSSLQKAHDAVGQRDYRQALSYALDARERAQDAARDAADGKAKARSAAQSLVDDVTRRLAQLESRIRTAESARVPAKELRDPKSTASQARNALQEARTALTAGKYKEVTSGLSGVREKLDTALGAIDPLLQHPSRRRR